MFEKKQQSAQQKKFRFVPSSGQQVASIVPGAGSRWPHNPNSKGKEEDSPGVALGFCLAASTAHGERIHFRLELDKTSTKARTTNPVRSNQITNLYHLPTADNDNYIRADPSLPYGIGSLKMD